MFDVYARIYVPQWQITINTAPARTVSTGPATDVDYARHRSVFEGLLAPRRPEIVPLNLFRTPQHTELTPSTYFNFFDNAMVLENQALLQELGHYSMFNVPLTINRSDEHGYTCTLVVPGLQEYTPPVFVGDVISLRQVWWDQAYAMHGIQYDAIVTGLQRSKELLQVMVSGLRPATMRFNVIFQLQASRIEPMRLAVAMTQESLNQSSSSARTNHEGEHTTGDAMNGTNNHTPSAESSWVRAMLFPEVGDGALQTTLNSRTINRQWYDAALNYEQRRAVDSSCRQNYGQMPFLISGPPGTGKTKTLVETALQLLAGGTTSLLVCAPSDQAADTLLQRLRVHVPHSRMLRLSSPARSFAEVPGDVLPYCYVHNDRFDLPPLKELMQYDVVVAACRDAAMFVNANVTNQDLFRIEHEVAATLRPLDPHKPYKLHWQALLLDEAAQATEPEAAIPFAVVTPPCEHDLLSALPAVVMAGDERQLGPRTSSKLPAIELSLFGRLFDRAVYADHPLARSRVTGKASRTILTQDMLPIQRPAFATLVRNYRSHPAILAMPSRLFYHDTLLPEAAHTEGLLDWDGWRGRGWPVLFCPITGDDDLDRDGGGWFNLTETAKACEYAASLHRSGLVAPRDICIISPFRAQVQRLRKLARSDRYNLWDVNIGPLEAFQGLESRVVILCTTRAQSRFLDDDEKRGWGIVHDPKRFNVAMTRAKEGLIVIGSQAVLETNSNWRAFLSFCARHRLWDDVSGGWDAVSPEGPVSVLETAMLMKIGVPASGKYVGLSLVASLDEEMMISGVAAQLELDEQEYSTSDNEEE